MSGYSTPTDKYVGAVGTGSGACQQSPTSPSVGPGSIAMTTPAKPLSRGEWDSIYDTIYGQRPEDRKTIRELVNTVADLRADLVQACAERNAASRRADALAEDLFRVRVLYLKACGW